MAESRPDRWLLPRRQTEYPARELIDEAQLHARREATFLVLASLFLIATTFAFVRGARPFLDLAALIAGIAPDVTLPIALKLPIGALPTTIGFVVIMLVNELYGRRRATALVVTGLVASVACAALVHVTEVLTASEPTFVFALAFGACYVVGHAINLLVFDAMRRRLVARRLGLRALATSILAQPLAWAAFGGALHVYTLQLGQPDVPLITALAVGPALYAIACVLVLALPLVIAARVLRLYLRVSLDELAPERRLPAALIVDDEDGERDEPRWARGTRAPSQPFSSAELRFFTEGEQLAEQ